MMRLVLSICFDDSVSMVVLLCMLKFCVCVLNYVRFGWKCSVVLSDVLISDDLVIYVSCGMDVWYVEKCSLVCVLLYMCML